MENKINITSILGCDVPIYLIIPKVKDNNDTPKIPKNAYLHLSLNSFDAKKTL